MENKFKIGQAIRLNKDPSGTYEIYEGDIGVITNIDTTPNYEVDFGNISQWVDEESLEPFEKKEYVGADKENEFLYTGGEVVVVTDIGAGYRFYSDLAEKMGLPNWFEGDSLKNGDVGTVVGYLPHEDPNYDQVVGVDVNGQQYLIGINGVKKIEDDKDMEECHKYVCQYYENRELVLFDKKPDENEFKILNVVTYYK